MSTWLKHLSLLMKKICKPLYLVTGITSLLLPIWNAFILSLYDANFHYFDFYPCVLDHPQDETSFEL